MLLWSATARQRAFCFSSCLHLLHSTFAPEFRALLLSVQLSSQTSESWVGHIWWTLLLATAEDPCISHPFRYAEADTPRSPRACFEGFEQFEVSCAHIPSSVRGRRSAAARDLVHSQMALKPWPPSCSCFCVTSRQHCWRSWEYPANGYEWNSEGWVPRACVFPFQAPLVLFVFCRCEVGTTHWTQCNETPVKFARFPVTGLIEGRSYIFRVRAVNKAGVSLPSRVSEPVAALDPADRARLRSKMSFLQLAWEI